MRAVKIVIHFSAVGRKRFRGYRVVSSRLPNSRKADNLECRPISRPWVDIEEQISIGAGQEVATRKPLEETEADSAEWIESNQADQGRAINQTQDGWGRINAGSRTYFEVL